MKLVGRKFVDKVILLNGYFPFLPLLQPDTDSIHKLQAQVLMLEQQKKEVKLLAEVRSCITCFFSNYF